MDDKTLVERLRNTAGPIYDGHRNPAAALAMHEAADTIEAQATRIEALEAALRECATAYNGYAAQIITKQALESKP